MNLAERIKARRESESLNRLQQKKAEHEKKIAELGAIPFESILEWVEKKFEDDNNHYIKLYGSGEHNPYGHFKNPIKGLEVSQVPRVWINPIKKFLEENGFKVRYNSITTLTLEIFLP